MSVNDIEHKCRYFPKVGTHTVLCTCSDMPTKVCLLKSLQTYVFTKKRKKKDFYVYIY